MIKVAFDTGPLKSGDAVRGIGVHSRILLEHLKKIRDIKVEAVDVRTADLSKYDLVHYQKFHPYFLSIPFKKSVPSILTIHDLIYLIYPKHYPSGIRGRLIYLLQKFLVKKMDAIITISETSKKDIARFLGIPQGKIFAIHLAQRELFRVIENKEQLGIIKEKYKLPERFVLYVGDVNYNKNILGMVEAVKKAKLPLVIIGKQAVSTDFDREHIENRPLRRLLEKYGGDKDIIRLGFVDDKDLVGIYNLASVYCQPSFYEGFGLPVLEAFASGCPVVAARTQALVEIGEPAALFFDPKSPKDIAEKIRMVVEDVELREQLIETGKVLVKNYSWALVAKKTAEVYRRVAGK
jgi:glycosyltransferase involved in cell wall biosynthesis